MDAVSNTILEVALGEESLPPMVNLVHPRPISWSAMMDGVRSALGVAGFSGLQSLPFSEWFKMLENHAEIASQHNIQKIVSDSAVGRYIYPFFYFLSQLSSCLNFSELWSQPMTHTVSPRKWVEGLPLRLKSRRRLVPPWKIWNQLVT